MINWPAVLSGALVAYVGFISLLVYDIKGELSKPAAAKACVVKPRVML